MVILEAMASGKPVVASELPGVSDVVDHGKTGYLVPPWDPEKLTKAIDSLLQNPSNAAKMGEEGRVAARLRYDWEKVNSSYVNIYEGTIAGLSERGISLAGCPQVVRVISSSSNCVKMHKVMNSREWLHLPFKVFLVASSFVWCFSERLKISAVFPLCCEATPRIKLSASRPVQYQGWKEINAPKFGEWLSKEMKASM